MNNRGQVLVTFIIFLPILLILFTLVIDLGFLYIEKRNVSNNVYDAVEYYLTNKDNSDIIENTKKLLNKNLDDIEIIINDTSDYIEITVIKEYKGLNIIKKEDEINITYKGIKDSNKIIKG